MDMVGKVLQDERVQNFGDAIRTGALKVRPFAPPLVACSLGRDRS